MIHIFWDLLNYLMANIHNLEKRDPGGTLKGSFSRILER